MSECPSYDNSASESCYDALSNLYAAYVNVISGSRARVRMGTRWSEYHPGNAAALKTLYMQIYQQCQDERKCTLPDLSVSTIQRGPPASGCYPAPYGAVAGRGPFRRY